MTANSDVIRRPTNGPQYLDPEAAEPPAPTAEAPQAPPPEAPAPAPLQPAPGALQSFNNFVGTTTAFALNGGRYLLDYQSVGLGDLYFEAQFPGPLYPTQPGPPFFVAIRTLNAMQAANNASQITLASGGTFRLSNTGQAAASVTITGPL